MAPFSPIAIIGRSCVLPGALSPDALWQAVSAGRDLISQAPSGRWGLPRDAVMCSPDAPRPDHAWSDRGGYVEGFEQVFDPDGFALPADSILALDPLFQWVLHSGREALRDAGLDTGRIGARTAVVMGNLSFPTSTMARYAEIAWLRQLLGPERMAGIESPDPRNRFMSGLPALILARSLGLQAGAFSLDAACASALYAIKLGCDRLQDGRADVVLAGAVNRADDLFIHVGFCALSAMSRTGQSRPFHAGADGLVPAEGAAFLVLRRLEDALRDGDPIHGVIRGIGLSNDGRGRGLLAPSEDGQERAIRSAWAQADLDPGKLGLLECHATGTPVGDATELRSTAAAFAGAAEPIPLGSLKSNLGHLVTVAGAAGLIKVLEAMRHGLRPPTLHAEDPNPALEGTPFRLLHEAEPWTGEGPRRAAVSAFGFGGNNAHLVVEALNDSIPMQRARRERPAVAVVGMGAQVGEAVGAADFARRVQAEAPMRGPAASVRISLDGLRFPPADLQQSLPQQLMVLQAAREATGDRAPAESTRTGAFVGMGCDPEIARYGARWRLGAWAETLGLPADWSASAKDAFAGPLQAAGVVGTMPNIPANRLNRQLDLGGPGFTVSAEENSGLVALDLAMRALQAGELDAALVGAVDLSHEPVHQEAARALLPEERQAPGDAAVVLVLKRLEDAEKNGDPVLAVLREPPELASAGGGIATDRMAVLPEGLCGHAHAATALVQVAAATVLVHQQPGGRIAVEVEGMEESRGRVVVEGPTGVATLPASAPLKQPVM